jgi:DNA polymerase-3 subunit delta'
MNWGLLGHQWAVDLLKENLSHNKPHHAYLITGPQGIGKRTFALQLAQSINCPQPSQPGEPCRVCRTCIKLQEMTHPDLSIVEAEGVGGVITVDQIRELQHRLALTPYESRYRIALLLHFEDAHISASNALLKTLEEPNPQVVILLTAVSPIALLPTIVSRCETIRLRPLPVDELAEGLQKQFNIPREKADQLARFSSGRPGRAIELYNDPDEFSKRKESLEDLFRLVSATRLERFAYSESLAKDKDAIRNLLETWITLWRDVLLRACAASIPLTNLDYSDQIDYFAQNMDRSTAFELIARTEQTLEWISKYVNARLALDVLFLDLPQMPTVLPGKT